jgi:GxxExxY protein
VADFATFGLTLRRFALFVNGRVPAVLSAMASEQELNRIAGEIVAAGIAIHREFGPGCFESAYAPCLAYELDRRRLRFQSKIPLALKYHDLFIPRAYEADFIVEEDVLIEVKAIEAIAAVHLRQLRTYLCLTGCPLGLLMNFGAVTMRDGLKRVVNNFPVGTQRLQQS